ncbi:MAG: DUF1223 domain-containing protein [Pseudomonadota bacterium]
MMKSLASFAAFIAAALPVSAEPILVELFASQNCAACPKAHDTLSEVNDQRDDVLILTWSVDYWDYLGEPDPMAMEMSTERQAAYADLFRLRGPYTPQTVYNGAEQCPGNRPNRVARRLAAAASARAEEAEQEHAASMVSFQQTSKGWAVSVPPGLPSDIHLIQFRKHGDHETDMVHPVTGLAKLSHLPFGGAVSTVPVCESGCALVVQAPGHGKVYGAQRLN